MASYPGLAAMEINMGFSTAAKKAAREELGMRLVLQSCERRAGYEASITKLREKSWV